MYAVLYRRQQSNGAVCLKIVLEVSEGGGRPTSIALSSGKAMF
jgi:hypothetical protein